MTARGYILTYPTASPLPLSELALQIAMPPTALLLPHNCEHAVHTDAPARLVAPAMIPTGKPNVWNTAASIPPYEKSSCVVYSAFSPLTVRAQFSPGPRFFATLTIFLFKTL